MKSMKILHTFSYSVRKAAMVERFNQTFEGLMAKETHRTGGRWIDKVKMVLYKYNYVNVHSFIKMTPAQGELLKNQPKLARLFNIKYSKIKNKTPKFKVGDLVRLFVDKGKFGRSYQQDFTNELFVIDKVFTNLPKPRYQLKDLKGEIILGNAIDEELRRYTPPTTTATAAAAALPVAAAEAAPVTTLV